MYEHFSEGLKRATVARVQNGELQLSVARHFEISSNPLIDGVSQHTCRRNFCNG